MNSSGKAGDNLGTTVTIKSGRQTVTDKSVLPVITSSNVLNNGAQRARGCLPARVLTCRWVSHSHSWVRSWGCVRFAAAVRHK